MTANTGRVSQYPDSAVNSDSRGVPPQTRVSDHPCSGIASLARDGGGTLVAGPEGMSTHLQLVRDDHQAPAALAQAADDPALRPASFDDYIGQPEVIANLCESVSAVKRGGWQLNHMLFAGPAGLGKTSLAAVVAAELGCKFRATAAPAIEHKGALASLLTTLDEGDVLFIDEIHALDRKIAECLYTAMEDFKVYLPSLKGTIEVKLPKFTLLAATTHAGKLPKPLRDRFGFIWQLKPYTLPEMAAIIARSAGKLGVAIDEEGALAVARASRGTPRIANRFLHRLRDVATNAVAAGALVVFGDRTGKHGAIDGPLAITALARLGIDHLGLDPLDRRYLAVVAERPVGIEAICAELGEDRSTIEDAVEPYLMQAGLIKRGGKGRLATEAGRTHLAEVA